MINQYGQKWHKQVFFEFEFGTAKRWHHRLHLSTSSASSKLKYCCCCCPDRKLKLVVSVWSTKKTLPMGGSVCVCVWEYCVGWLQWRRKNKMMDQCDACMFSKSEQASHKTPTHKSPAHARARAAKTWTQVFLRQQNSLAPNFTSHPSIHCKLFSFIRPITSFYWKWSWLLLLSLPQWLLSLLARAAAVLAKVRRVCLRLPSAAAGRRTPRNTSSWRVTLTPTNATATHRLFKHKPRTTALRVPPVCLESPRLTAKTLELPLASGTAPQPLLSLPSLASPLSLPTPCKAKSKLGLLTFCTDWSMSFMWYAQSDATSFWKLCWVFVDHLRTWNCSRRIVRRRQRQLGRENETKQ